MELTAKEIVEIFLALTDIRISCRLRYVDARKLKNLVDIFQTRAKIISDLEHQALEEYKGKIVGNELKFPTTGDAKGFIEAKKELYSEVELVEFEKVDLSNYKDNIEIDIDSIDILEKVIIFEEV